MILKSFLFFISTLLHQLFGVGECCRFSPTCTHYAIAAIHEHGILRGGVLAFRRILRCRPLSSFGYDPIPSTQTSRKLVHAPRLLRYNFVALQKCAQRPEGRFRAFFSHSLFRCKIRWRIDQFPTCLGTRRAA